MKEILLFILVIFSSCDKNEVTYKLSDYENSTWVSTAYYPDTVVFKKVTIDPESKIQILTNHNLEKGVRESYLIDGNYPGEFILRKNRETTNGYIMLIPVSKNEFRSKSMVNYFRIK